MWIDENLTVPWIAGVGVLLNHVHYSFNQIVRDDDFKFCFTDLPDQVINRRLRLAPRVSSSKPAHRGINRQTR